MGQIWATSRSIIKTIKAGGAFRPDKISILNSVWEKELGLWAKYWTLLGVRRGTLYVSARSSAASQELSLRETAVRAGLNGYFSSAWIKAIKIYSPSRLDFRYQEKEWPQIAENKKINAA